MQNVIARSPDASGRRSNLSRTSGIAELPLVARNDGSKTCVPNFILSPETFAFR